MSKKYWIIFLVAVNIIFITGIVIYFKIQGKPIAPPKIELPKIEKPIEEPVTGETRKNVFMAHGMTPKEQKLLGGIFDKMSDGKDNAEIVFYDTTRPYYFHDSNNVYWYKEFSDEYRRVDCKKADFKLLDTSVNNDIGICEKSVFVRGVRDVRIDGESLVTNYGNYLADKKTMYYKNVEFDRKKGSYVVELKPIEGNPTNVETATGYSLGVNYAVANGKLFYRDKLVSKVDLNTLKRIDGFYFKDKSAYYYLSEDEGSSFIANISNFILLPVSDGHGNKYVKIGKDIYLKNTKLAYADAGRLSAFDAETIVNGKTKLVPCTDFCPYVWDGKNVYHNGRRLVNADPKTFRLIGYGKKTEGSFYGSQPEYAKDKFRVYFGDRVVNGADPATFEPVVSGRFYFEFGKDKDYAYFEDKIIKNADPSTFKPMSPQASEGCPYGKYSKDAKYVFYKWDIVRGADPETFESLNAPNGDFGKDKDGYYREYEKAEEVSLGECQMG